MGLLTKKFNATPPSTGLNVVEDNEQLSSTREVEHQHDPSAIESIPEVRYGEVDPMLERRVVRKMDFRIVPLVSALYVLAFLDRSNIGNARIAGMREDLKLVGNDYQWLLTIFYITQVDLTQLVRGTNPLLAISHLSGKWISLGSRLCMD